MVQDGYMVPYPSCTRPVLYTVPAPPVMYTAATGPHHGAGAAVPHGNGHLGSTKNGSPVPATVASIESCYSHRGYASFSTVLLIFYWEPVLKTDEKPCRKSLY